MDRQSPTAIIMSAAALSLSAAAIAISLRDSTSKSWKSYTNWSYTNRNSYAPHKRLNFAVTLEAYPKICFVYSSCSAKDIVNCIKWETINQAKAYNSKAESDDVKIPLLYMEKLECKDESGLPLDYRIPLHAVECKHIRVVQKHALPLQIEGGK